MKLLLILMVVALNGCVSRPPVSCDWRLKPINVPAPADTPREPVVAKKDEGAGVER